jgi:hypothetical protein
LELRRSPELGAKPPVEVGSFMVKSAIGVVLCVALFFPVVVGIYARIGVPGVQPSTRYIMSVWPEPAERTSFLAGLVLLPAGLFGYARLTRRWDVTNPRLRRAVELTLAVLLTATVVWALRSADDVEKRHFFHLRRNPFYEFPLLTLPLVALVPGLLIAGARAPRIWWRVAAALVAVALVGVAVAMLIDDRCIYASQHHLSAVFYPVVEVHRGKMLLVDCPSQYGLYPQFLEPLFAVVGLSVLKFALVMAPLTAGGFWCIWRFLGQSLRNPVAALIGTLAVVFYSWFQFLAETRPDLYYQYFPVRFIFPACMIPLAWRYFQRGGRGNYWAAMLVGAAGILWNLDSGVPALGAWCLALVYGELGLPGWGQCWRRIGAHLAGTVVAVAGVVSMHALATYAACGELPGYAHHLAFQQMFAIDGLNMLPMPWPGPWILPILIYLAGLAYAAHAWAAGRTGPMPRMLLLLAVLGLGLFTYYQGRSHRVVLTLAWWPCFVMLAVFLDLLLERLRARTAEPLPWAAAGLSAWLLAGATVGLFVNSEFLFAHLEATWTGQHRSRQPLAEEIAMVRRGTAPGEPVIALTDAEAMFHLNSGISSGCHRGVAQMVLLEDSEILKQRTETGVKVLMDRTTMAGRDYASRMVFPLLNHVTRTGYECVDETPDAYLLQKGRPMLDPDPAALVHLGFRQPSGRLGRLFRPVTLAPQATLEVVVKPSSGQTPHAELVSNHAGAGCHGLTVEQSGDDRNHFHVVLGDGGRWHDVAGFTLPPEQWSHLAVILRAGTVAVFVNGECVAPDVARPRLSESETPFVVGNWAQGDRPFQGAIREVRLLNRAATVEEIQDNHRRVLQLSGTLRP